MVLFPAKKYPAAAMGALLGTRETPYYGAAKK
jgi:hypothetical protein